LQRNYQKQAEKSAQLAKKIAEAGGKISSTFKETIRSRRKNHLNSQRNYQKQAEKSAQLAKKITEAGSKRSAQLDACFC
jgi:phenylpyruvate tautomerase PptA (4-oxalocrotonate tautomerase family)